MKYCFPIFLLSALGALLAFVFGPLFGDPIDIEKTLLRAAIVLILVPLWLFYQLHPTSTLTRWNKRLVDTCLALGGVCALLSILLIAKAIFRPLIVSIPESFLFLYFGRRVWLNVIPAEKVIEGLQCVKSSPAGDVYNEGLRLLEDEADPRERKKLASALTRFKDGWHLR